MVPSRAAAFSNDAFLGLLSDTWVRFLSINHRNILTRFHHPLLLGFVSDYLAKVPSRKNWHK